jgi:hypothetical protein
MTTSSRAACDGGSSSLELQIDWLAPRDFYDPPPVGWKAMVAERIEVWRRWALQHARNLDPDEPLSDCLRGFCEGLWHPSKLIKACLIDGPPPEREVSVHHGELGDRSAARLRRLDPTPEEQEMGVQFAFGVDDDRILINTEAQDASIELSRKNGPPILLCCADPWNPPMIFTIDGSEPTFRGFAEWLSRAVVSQGLDSELEDEEDSNGSLLLSRWLLFGDGDRREEVLDWRLEAGMVSEVRFSDVGFLSFSEEERALALGPGRDAYHAFIRERIDPTFEPAPSQPRDLRYLFRW